MKVGIDVSQSIYGSGVSDYVINLVQNLPSGSIVPVGFSLRRQKELQKIIPNVKTYPIPPSMLNILWNSFHKINFETFSSDIDIYHASDWAQAPSKAKSVTTIHDLTPFLYAKETLPEVVTVHKNRMRWSVKECTHFIAVSQSTKRDLQKTFSIPDEKISVIPEALPARFELTPKASKYQDYVCAMGSRQPRKNIDRLINAFRKYKSKYKLPSTLVIIGEMPTSQSSAEIRYTGYISDQEVVDTIAGSQGFVYPSVYEGFGLPILLGFHCEVPVVAANFSSIPEVSGDAAVLVDTYNEEAIAKGIAQAMEAKKELLPKGRKQLTKFSWAKTAKLTEQVYQEILK